MILTYALVCALALIPQTLGDQEHRRRHKHRNSNRQPVGFVDNSNHQSFDNKFTHAHGSGASAGQANARQGNAMSINTANHEASKGRTRTDAMSSNAASGLDPTVSGAAQAGGGVESGRQRGSQSNRNSGFVNFRRKRQAFGFFGGSGSSANSLGGGRVGLGRVGIHNRAGTFSSPYSSSGYASGSANGDGYDVDIWNAAMSDSHSGRRKRETAGVASFGLPQENVLL